MVNLGDIYMELEPSSRTWKVQELEITPSGLTWVTLVPFMQHGMNVKHDKILCDERSIDVFHTLIASGREALLYRLNGRVTRSGGESLA